MLGLCLTIGTPEAWNSFSIVALARLGLIERAQLAFSILSSLDYDDALLTAAAALRGNEPDLPVFLGGMAEARAWAEFASAQELKAFALAAFEAMPARDQAAFFHHISAIEVAA